MSQNEQPNKLPIELNLLDEKKSIVVLNKEHQSIEEHIKKELEADKYNSIVTADNYDVMKASSQELGKTSKFISRFRIDKKESEMEDINIFDKNLVGYCKLITDKQDEIKKGLDVFDEKKRKQVVEVCKNYEQIRIKEIGLREEFYDIDIYSMTQTGYMTATGLISKKGREEVDRRLNEKLALQNKVDNRLLNLENECLKNDIAPMSKEYVQGFIYEDDANYQEKLNALIQIEVKRAEAEKKRIEDEAKAKAEKEAKEKVLAEQQKAKAELHARYESQIRTASIPTLTRINLELQSYEVAVVYELRQMCNERQRELESQTTQEIDESPQEEHLKAIQEEKVEEVEETNQTNSDGKVTKTLSINIRVPAGATDEQVIGAVINMIKADRFPLVNIEVN